MTGSKNEILALSLLPNRAGKTSLSRLNAHVETLFHTFGLVPRMQFHTRGRGVTFFFCIRSVSPSAGSFQPPGVLLVHGPEGVTRLHISLL